ncbi:MAG: hypothetical protein KGL37_06680 [Acidobacteriota bacterium]|nr:hypothetical protein [Acidobacteriota bacterium]
MGAYLLLLVAVASRFLVLPHVAWLNFTAVGGSLLYFGARRRWWEMALPLGALMVSDYYLTAKVYGYPFHWVDYGTTWIWYLAAMILGTILLRTRATFPRFITGVLLGPTSFFIVSNFSVWVVSVTYPHTLSGLMTCYAAGIPFYGNDLLSTALVAGLAFGLPEALRRMHLEREAALAGK